MPRRVKVRTQELGHVELFLIYETKGLWEEEWRPLQGNLPVRDVLTVVSGETMRHCLKGWSSPFVKALGLPPYGCLIKIPSDLARCHNREKCPFFDRTACLPTAKKMPSCFEPESSEEERPLLTELVRLWKEGVYVVLVQEGV